MRFKYARLTIERIGIDPETVNIAFDWRAFESSHREEHEIQVKGWEFLAETLSTIFEKLEEEPGKKVKQKLLAIGDQVWRLFPPEVQEQLQRFDLLAEKVYGESGSVLPLIIHTDYLSVPWELCITRRGRRKEELPWYKRFLIATQIYGISRPDEIPSREERKKVAVVLTPFHLPTEETESLSNEYNSLVELIDRLKTQYGVEVSLYERPEDRDQLYEIETVLKEGGQDLLIYIGGHSTDKDKLPVYNPTTEKREYFDIKNINVGGTTERVVFLDACSTAIRKRDTAFVCEEPLNFLERSPAYIGTIADIPATTGIAFATEFLKSLFTKGVSLTQAFYEARTETLGYLEKRYPEHEVYRVHSTMFSLYGRNDDILLNSFRFPRESVSFIYPQMIDSFISKFKSPIYPSSLPILSLKMKETLQEVVNAVEHADSHFIADLSITQASDLLSRYRGDPDRGLVIISGVFRLLPYPSDSTLYFFGDLSEYGFFYSLDPLVYCFEYRFAFRYLS